MFRIVHGSLAAGVVSSAAVLMMGTERVALQATEMANLLGGGGGGEFACGLLAGVSFGLAMSTFFGCGPCGLASLIGSGIHLVAC